MEPISRSTTGACTPYVPPPPPQQSCFLISIVVEDMEAQINMLINEAIYTFTVSLPKHWPGLLNWQIGRLHNFVAIMPLIKDVYGPSSIALSRLCNLISSTIIHGF